MLVLFFPEDALAAVLGGKNRAGEEPGDLADGRPAASTAAAQVR
ncbi:hypothetical protein GCM10027174_09870 [Salinifilum aidingensis]